MFNAKQPTLFPTWFGFGLILGSIPYMIFTPDNPGGGWLFIVGNVACLVGVIRTELAARNLKE